MQLIRLPGYGLGFGEGTNSEAFFTLQAYGALYRQAVNLFYFFHIKSIFFHYLDLRASPGELPVHRLKAREKAL